MRPKGKEIVGRWYGGFGGVGVGVGGIHECGKKGKHCFYL